jgi:hypothetical protein
MLPRLAGAWLAEWSTTRFVLEAGLTWGEHLIYTRVAPGRGVFQAMKVVVVGGHSRNIGKTSVMAGLIRGSEPFDWTAVKITQYGRGICSQDGVPWDCAPTEHPFALTEEEYPRGRGDTCRFLAAGARRSLWLRVREGQLGEAFPCLLEALDSAEHVMIESNSILSFLKPAAYVVVLDRSRRDFKPSARQLLERADALVCVGPAVDARAWPGLSPAIFERKPVFQVSARDYSNPELCRFVRQRLETPEAEVRRADLPQSTPTEELPWPR